MTFVEVLNLRTRFEEIVKDFNMNTFNSGIDTIEWFIENGHRSNSLRNGFNEAMDIAKTIKEYSDECAKSFRSWESI